MAIDPSEIQDPNQIMGLALLLMQKPEAAVHIFAQNGLEPAQLEERLQANGVYEQAQAGGFRTSPGAGVSSPDAPPQAPSEGGFRRSPSVVPSSLQDLEVLRRKAQNGEPLTAEELAQLDAAEAGQPQGVPQPQTPESVRPTGEIEAGTGNVAQPVPPAPVQPTEQAGPSTSELMAALTGVQAPEGPQVQVPNPPSVPGPSTNIRGGNLAALLEQIMPNRRPRPGGVPSLASVIQPLQR